MEKKWKTIKPTSYKNLKKCLKELKKKYYISFWIEDIVKNKKNKILITKKTIDLYRIKVSSLGFKKPTTLKAIYKKFKEKTSIITRTSGLITEIKQANKIVQKGSADLIAIGRSFINNPMLIYKGAKQMKIKNLIEPQYKRMFD